MLLEFDADQRLWQDTVRGVVAKECPPALVRAVVDDGADSGPPWRAYTGLGWTELTEQAEAVELGIVLEELGAACDPTPYLATMTWFAPLAGEAPTDGAPGTAVFDGVTAAPDGDGWLLDGTARNVLDGDRAAEIAVVTDAGVFVVPASAVEARPVPVFDPGLHFADLVFEGVRVTGAERRAADPAAALDLARTGLALTMVGACRRVLDLVLAHVRDRRQFGVPIGSFQAVKHKAADMHVAIERARALAYYAARTVADGDPRRPLAAAMAKAAAGECQSLVFRHGLQLFGGMGYTWENDLQFALKRAKAGELLLGGAAEHRAFIAAAPSGEGSIRLTFDAEVEAFRAEFAAFLDAHLPSEADAAERPNSTAHIPDWARPWQRRLFDAGWLLPGNSPEFGGRNAGIIQQYVHLEELARRRIYHSFNPQGLGIIAASLLSFGTPEQKRRWAVPILRAEITAALGMSEPEAGSDLAGLRTRAVLDGEEFVVNGQKVWTSGAHDADVILAFVRTDPKAPKHKGISVLVVPTDTPGVTRRPFGSIAGRADLDFNEVFFENARVPKENLVGPLNDGWRVANGSLGHERTLLWLSFADRLEDLVRDFEPVTPLDRDRFATLVMDAHALRLMGSTALAKAARGDQDVAALSVLKVFGSEAVQSASEAALDSAGGAALAHPAWTAPFAPLNLDEFSAGWFERYVRSFSGTIAGGTSEIQRTIIAERVLGLPRA
ncbi:hypothetical protein GCM10022221_23640 [Actinocorallia aurea]